ncbi:MAG: serine/threonine-protein kinase [Kofleriaceae bacterium]
MPVCRKCKKEWPAEMTACPDDGWSFTVEVDQTQAPAQDHGWGASATNATSAGNLAVAQPGEETDLRPGTVVGEYRIEKKIGEGGMGAVYGAVHPLIGKKAAIKVISAVLGADASAVNRFVQEARSVNQIGHPNIVDVFAFGELPDGRNYFVMEHLQGESLADRLGRAPMPLGNALEILDQVADALEAAHEKQIVHRDLKPDNVFLAAVRGGRTMVKLLDFGIAKLSTGEGEGGIAKTRTGMMMGTPGYLSPEQARGKNVDHRTDIYALGCMTFEIVCGRLPFVADNAMDIVLSHMTAPPPRAREFWAEIPAPLDELINQMLDKDAAKRPSLAALRTAFAELFTSGLVTVEATGTHAAYRSGVGGRIATPARGTPITPTPGGGMPTPMPGGPMTGAMAAAALQTTPPLVGEVVPAPAKKSGLLIGAIIAVVAIGGAGALFATRGGSEPAKQPEVAAAPPAAAPPVAAPPVEPPKPAEPPEPAKPPEPAAPVVAGYLDISVNVNKAKLELDGAPIAIKGRRVKVPVDQAGTHTLTITSSGRVPYEKTLEISGGGTTVLDITLERVASGKKPPTGKPSTGKPSTGKPTTTPVDRDGTLDPFAN